MTATDPLTTLKDAIQKRLDLLIPPATDGTLYAAARYSLLAGGKRLRPLLTLVTAHAFDCEIDDAIDAACALELVHTYSLIHDDLPCMDDDDLRRGRPSLHRAYNEAHAVLTGDYLLTYAFEVIANIAPLSAEQRIALTRILAANAGGSGMIGGQLSDLAAEGQQISYDALCNIHRKKTGALISAAVQFGGVIANVAHDTLATLAQFGMRCGLAFQLIDDVLDVTSSDTILGKSAASDIANQKAASPSVIGINNAKSAAEQLLQEGKELLTPLNRDTSLLLNLANKLVYRSF